MAACFFSIQNRDTVVCSKKEERLYREGVSMGKTPIEILAPDLMHPLRRQSMPVQMLYMPEDRGLEQEHMQIILQKKS
jgi:hypothetical protein